MREDSFLVCGAPISLDAFNTDFTGFLTADRTDALAAHTQLGGYLLRLGDVFLVCSQEEALGWGWTSAELEGLPQEEERRSRTPRASRWPAPAN